MPSGLPQHQQVHAGKRRPRESHAVAAPVDSVEQIVDRTHRELQAIDWLLRRCDWLISVIDSLFDDEALAEQQRQRVYQFARESLTQLHITILKQRGPTE